MLHPAARDSRRRSRSRSESDSEEERRRHRRRREREDCPEERRRNEEDSDTKRDASRRSRSPRHKYHDDYRATRDRRIDDESRRDRGSREPRRRRDREDERHRDPDHRRRTEDRHAVSRHSSRRHNERSPRRSRSRIRSRENSPPKLIAYRKAAGPLPDQQAAFSMTSGRRPQKDERGNTAAPFGDRPPIQKELPNFGNSGLLAEAANTVQKADGSKVVLKYHEPPEARKPSEKDAWKLFVFKGKDICDTLELHLKSCWLIGRDVAVADLAAEHPSVSKQHAVIQFRHVEKRNEYGDRIGKVKPYLIDLESANGTFLNGKQIEGSRFVEARDKDLIQFGESTREYVVMLPPKE